MEPRDEERRLRDAMLLAESRRCAIPCAPALKTMALTDRIEISPRIMLGKPVIRGTRIPVELILRKLGEGATEADLCDAYPGLTAADIRAAVAYAADAPPWNHPGP